MASYSLEEIRNGTGWPAGVRFVYAGIANQLADALEALRDRLLTISKGRDLDGAEFNAAEVRLANEALLKAGRL